MNDESRMDDLLLADLPPCGRMSPSEFSMSSLYADFDFLGPLDSGDTFVALIDDSQRPDPISSRYPEHQQSQQDFDNAFGALSPTSLANLASLASLVHMASEVSSGNSDEAMPDGQGSFLPLLPLPTFISAKRKHVESVASHVAPTTQEALPNCTTFDFLLHLDEALVVTDDDNSHDDADMSMSEKPLKRKRFLSDDDPFEELHFACTKIDQSCEAIEDLLRLDASAAFRASRIVLSKEIYDYKTQSVKMILETCPYRYALNVAIKHRADASILKLLIRSAPQVVKEMDGLEESALHVLMKYKPEDSETTKALLSCCIELVTFTDAKGNTPLHTLAMWATPDSLKIIRLLSHLNPTALHQRNFNGLTPVDVSQQQSKCPEDISSYLRQRSENQQKRRAMECITGSSC